ncbi:SDR family NAD(P)-dependent oxidoreductase [Nonomuraea jiangxiensis]|uniref:NAD(P)-dependent dehydrogenase, short-chain alcohol dehydrogenase family n=1 Tax=Nonomuraea jiangxiensis TaxID=633440 RepID=A0A1G9D8E3_9ACTN|nr:SDR family oxidoreductase [Nonomuraea jiangxiensis]SDK60180.1 NAD(P)-dependent dehydrogenase, short-chain alcohol dehydrogenase family [Nonomuraea jiangxiensis]
MDRLYARVSQDGRLIDVVVANIGFGEFPGLADITEEHLDNILGINVKGTVFTVRKALPLLNDGASIVLVTSMASTSGQAGLSVYSASKAAVRSFARSWANELSGPGIRVNALAPGGTDTPAMDAALEASGLDAVARDQWRVEHSAAIPLRRPARPEEQAAAALVLASPESSYITGVELAADGGATQLGFGLVQDVPPGFGRGLVRTLVPGRRRRSRRPARTAYGPRSRRRPAMPARAG